MEVSSTRECAEALRAHKSFTFDSNFSILNLQNFGLKAEATTLLADALKSSNSLIDLNLGWNSIGSTGVEILSEVLPACTLEKLSLEVNGIEDLGVGYAAVALQHNRSITSLNLIGNEIGDTGAMSIAFLIKNNVYLKNLRMRYNKITALGGSYIADALKENENLEHLDLAWNSLCDKGGAAFVAALRVNSTLCRLDLSENKISQQIMDDINKLMQEPERKPKPPAPKYNGNNEEGGDSNGENDGEKDKDKRYLNNSAIGAPDTLPVNRELDLLMSTMRLEKERNSKEIARLLDENAELKKKSKEKEKDYTECKIALDHTLTENTELKKENRAYQHELSEYQEKTEAMRADVTQASRVLAFELENVRYQENKLAQELKELKTREDYLKDQFSDHDSFLHKELSKIGEEKTFITSQLQELSHQRTAMEVALRAAEEDKELELLQLSKDIENLKAQSKGQGDYDLTRSFQDLKKSKQIEQEMEKQLQDAQQRTRGREQVLLKQLQIFKIHGYTAERRALIALLRNTRRLLKKNRVSFKKVFICYAWYEESDKTDELQKRLKTLKEDLSLICNAVWLDLYNSDSSKGSMRAGIGESDNVIVVGTPTLKIKAENPKSAISMEIFNATKKHEIKRGSVIPLLYDGTIADSFPSSLSSGYPSKDFTDSANYVTQLVEMNPTAGVIATLYPLLSDYDTNGLGVEYNVVLESFRHELTITKKSLY